MARPREQARVLEALRATARQIVAQSTIIADSPGPGPVLVAVIGGALEAAIEAMGAQAAFDLTQPVLDGLIGAEADKIIARRQNPKAKTNE